MTKVITDGHVRPLLEYRQLTVMEQDEHDWAKSRDYEEFFRFKGQVYAMADFTSLCWGGSRNPEAFKGWDGVQAGSFFSGILIRYPRDEFGGIENGVVVGWYCG